MSEAPSGEWALRGCIGSVTAAELLQVQERVVIDLRSPGEHEEDQIPGSVNLPLFGDEERALVGLLYKSQSPDAAFLRGIELVRPRLVRLVEEICSLAREPLPAGDPLSVFEALTRQGMAALEGQLELQRVPALPHKPLVIHCWRGGLRSRSVVALLNSLGITRAVVLEGGYRAWRSVLVERIERWEPPPIFVLRGLTGVGKSLVLRAIEAERPGWTLDLEALAGHRSSMLGAIGLQPVSQKRFESRLAQRLEQLRGPCVVMEGESRKVGDRIIPVHIFAALESGSAIELHAPLEKRLRILREDYLATPAHLPALAEAIRRLEPRLNLPEEERDLAAKLLAGAIDQVTEILLQRHYDPLYRHAERGKKYQLRIDSSDPRAAGREVLRWIESALR
jgi:tRNA 2-selenouridine synthase